MAGSGILPAMSTLAEIENEAVKLPPQQMQGLMRFLGAQSEGHAPRSLPPAERAADLKCWAAAHEHGPGRPGSAIGCDAIYD